MNQSSKKALFLLLISGAFGVTQPVSAQNDAQIARTREHARRASCQSNLKQIALGYHQYAQDHKEKLPPARGWIDKLMPYVRSEAIFTCPQLTPGKKYGYAFNLKASGQSLANFASPAETVGIYETQILKRSAFGLGEMRANRHIGGANFAYVDGHVKWLLKSRKPSFELKPPQSLPGRHYH